MAPLLDPNSVINEHHIRAMSRLEEENSKLRLLIKIF